MIRGVFDRKGELFAYRQGNDLVTLEGELSGKIVGDYVVDLAGVRIWRIVGDALYTADSAESIGYFGAAMPDYLEL